MAFKQVLRQDPAFNPIIKVSTADIIKLFYKDKDKEERATMANDYKHALEVLHEITTLTGKQLTSAMAELNEIIKKLSQMQREALKQALDKSLHGEYEKNAKLSEQLKRKPSSPEETPDDEHKSSLSPFKKTPRPK